MEGEIRAWILCTYDLNRGISENPLQLRTLIMEIIEIRGVCNWQLVEPADVPPAGQQQTSLGCDQCPQAQPWGRLRTSTLICQLDGGLNSRLEQREKDFRFRGEMVIQRSLAYTHCLSNLMSGGIGKALRGEQFRRSVQNFLASSAAATTGAIFSRASNRTSHKTNSSLYKAHLNIRHVSPGGG